MNRKVTKAFNALELLLNKTGGMKMARKPFGGYTISFAKCPHSMKDVFGSGSITPSEMTKKLWKHAKSCGNAGK